MNVGSDADFLYYNVELHTVTGSVRVCVCLARALLNVKRLLKWSVGELALLQFLQMGVPPQFGLPRTVLWRECVHLLGADAIIAKLHELTGYMNDARDSMQELGEPVAGVVGSRGRERERVRGKGRCVFPRCVGARAQCASGRNREGVARSIGLAAAEWRGRSPSPDPKPETLLSGDGGAACARSEDKNWHARSSLARSPCHSLSLFRLWLHLPLPLSSPSSESLPTSISLSFPPERSERRQVGTPWERGTRRGGL